MGCGEPSIQTITTRGETHFATEAGARRNGNALCCRGIEEGEQTMGFGVCFEVEFDVSLQLLRCKNMLYFTF